MQVSTWAVSVAWAMLLVATLFALPAEAQRGPCAQDVQTLCPDHQPGDRQGAAQCLADNQDKLSQGCREHFQNMRAEVERFHSSCESDIQQFCGDLQPGQGGIMRCLKGHQADVSQACQQAMQDLRAKRRQ